MGDGETGGALDDLDLGDGEAGRALGNLGTADNGLADAPMDPVGCTRRPPCRQGHYDFFLLTTFLVRSKCFATFLDYEVDYVNFDTSTAS